LYARVSTERQAESQTIEQQLERLQAYAAQQAWRIDPEQTYRDDGVSGARLDRPALDRLRDAVARGDVDRVLITSPDRLARRYAYQVWLLEEFERAGCSVIFLERPPTGDPQDTLVIQIRGVVAEYERTVIADRMRRGRLAALRSGKLLPWSTPPYGYRVDPRCPRDPAGVRVEASEARVVEHIFAWYVEEGLTLYGIAQRLTEQQIPTATGRGLWNPSSVRKILINATYQGMAYGNQKQMVAAQRRHPLIGREPKGPGGESCRLRPPEEWIGVPVPAIVSTERFTQAQARLAQNQQWARRNTQGEYLLRRLVSCRQCGRAHHVCKHGPYAYYQCKGADTLILRGRAEPCRARRLPTARLDELVWADLCQVLTEPQVLDEAVRRARQGWLSSDERQARRQDLRRRQGEIERQIQRLIDAYTAEVLTLDELRLRRGKLAERLATLQREEQQVAAEAVKSDQLQAIAGQMEAFRARIAQGLDGAGFPEQRALIELLVDRVVVDAPSVEVRYVVPLTGLAARNGVLRSRHRAAEQRAEAAQRRSRDLPESRRGDPAAWRLARGAKRRVAGGAALLQRNLDAQAAPPAAGDAAADGPGGIGELTNNSAQPTTGQATVAIYTT
jgi:site-specific DNA recombinase